jgi:putative membrane protein
MSILATLALVKALHVIFMTAWFAGMFFLGRMVIYLAEALTAKQHEVIALMNTAIRRVTFIIVLPATFITIGLGLWLMVMTKAYTSPWFHLKMTLILVLLGQQHYLFRIVKQLRNGEVRHRPLFLRLFNELPFFLLLGIVLTVYSRDAFSGIVGMGLLFALVGGIFGLRAVFKKKAK